MVCLLVFVIRNNFDGLDGSKCICSSTSVKQRKNTVLIELQIAKYVYNRYNFFAFRFKPFSKGECVNTKLASILFICIAIIGNSFAMQNAKNFLAIPVEIDNRSNEVVTIMHPDNSPIFYWRFTMLWKGEKYSDPLGISDSRSIRIVTSKGHMMLDLMAQQNPVIVRLILAVNDETKWKKITEILAKGIIRLTARVQADGMIKLIQHKHSPQDGRPDVSLLAYEELLGTQEFATAEQILGVKPGENPNEVYRQQIAKFCNIYVHFSEAESIKQLIQWAGQKLGVPNS